jgi:hypothetical protein
MFTNGELTAVVKMWKSNVVAMSNGKTLEKV